MKIKGLSQTVEYLKTLEGRVQTKIDSIEWDGDTVSAQEKDHQKDEYYNEALNILLEARENIESIKDLQLEDF